MERAVGRLEGVAQVETTIANRTIRIRPAKDKAVDFSAVPGALWQAGFHTEWMKIDATGTVESGPGGTRFRISGWPEAYPLDAGDRNISGKQRLRASVKILDGVPHLTLAK